MTIEQERQLYNRMRDGDDQAREDLILGHKWLIRRMTQKYSKNADAEDIEQEAWAALIRVVDGELGSYDINKGQLGNYAPLFMRTEIGEYLDRQRHVIRLPVPQMNAVLKLLKIRKRLEQDLGRLPSKEELMVDPEVISNYNKFKKVRKMTIDLDTYISYLEYTDPVRSLQEEIPYTESLTLEDQLEDPLSDKQLKLIDDQDLLGVLTPCLSQEEYAVFRLQAQGYTRREICEQLDIKLTRKDYLIKSGRKKIHDFIAGDPKLQEDLRERGYIE